MLAQFSGKSLFAVEWKTFQSFISSASDIALSIASETPHEHEHETSISFTALRLRRPLPASHDSRVSHLHPLETTASEEIKRTKFYCSLIASSSICCLTECWQEAVKRAADPANVSFNCTSASTAFFVDLALPRELYLFTIKWIGNSTFAFLRK